MDLEGKDLGILSAVGELIGQINSTGCISGFKKVFDPLQIFVKDLLQANTQQVKNCRAA